MYGCQLHLFNLHLQLPMHVTCCTHVLYQSIHYQFTCILRGVGGDTTGTAWAVLLFAPGTPEMSKSGVKIEQHRALYMLRHVPKLLVEIINWTKVTTIYRVGLFTISAGCLSSFVDVDLRCWTWLYKLCALWTRRALHPSLGYRPCAVACTKRLCSYS